MISSPQNVSNIKAFVFSLSLYEKLVVTLLMAPRNMVLLRVALFSLSLVVGKVASPMLLR